jgi:RNA polymerase sigma-70 factor, ECF subfamily
MPTLFHKPMRAVRPKYVELQRRSNEELMGALQTGNSDALIVLFDRIHPDVYTIAVMYVRDPAKAEDIMQLVFLEMFRKIAQFDPTKSSAQDWILRLAVNKAVDATDRS